VRDREVARARIPRLPDSLRKSADNRFTGLDVARCLALLGMMSAHVFFLNETTASNVGWQQRLVIGNSSALFAILAGVTMSLLTGRDTPTTGRRRTRSTIALVVRAGLIVVWGLALDRLEVGGGGIGVILPYYGLLFLLGIPFLGLRSRALFLWASVWALVAPALSYALRHQLPSAAVGGFGGLSLGGIGERLLLTGDYPAFTWLAYLLCGMAIGRLGLARRDVAAKLAAAGAVLAVTAGLLSAFLTRSPAARAALLADAPSPDIHTWSQLSTAMAKGLSGVTPTGTPWWLAVDAPHSGATLDFVRSGGLAMAVIGVALLVTRRFTRAWEVVFGAGAMTLSLYSLHLWMLLPTTWPDIGPPQLGPEVVVVMVVGSVFALLHLKGPLEAVVAAACRFTARVLLDRWDALSTKLQKRSAS
jgi:uncharacterized membrane protein